MSPERWTAFVAVLLVLVCSPGPDSAVVLRHALASTRAGVRAAAGVVAGLVAHTAAAALGVSAVLAARPEVLVALRAAGAAYLAWLGLRTLLGALRHAPLAGPGGGGRAGRPFRDGLAGNLLNPKALLLFLGLLPQFVAPPGVAGQVLLLAATTVVAAVLWWVVVIAAAARGRALLGHGRVRRAVDAGTGAVLVGVAVGVALT